MADEQPSAASGTFTALRHRNFRLMWISLLVSNSGTWMQAIAQDLLVYDLTGRALGLGIVSVARAVALISLSFVGGTIADRLDRRKLLIVTQTLFAASAALLGLLVQTGLVQVWHVVALSFINAVLLALDQPARQALLPQLVPRENLMNAVALNSIAFTGAGAIGPALAGPVVAALGTAWGFYLNAISFAAVIWAAWSLRLPPAPPRKQEEPVLTAVAEGMRYIAGAPSILLLVSLLTVFSFFAMPYQSLLPVFARQVFHGDVQELGWLRAATGMGALAGGFLLARFGGRVRRKGRLVIASGLGFTAILILFAFTPAMTAALALLFFAGMLFTGYQSTIQTLMHHLTDDAMRGRVMSLFAISVIGMWPLGTLPLSWAADQFGVAYATAGGALIAGLYALGVMVGGRKVLARLNG